MREVQQLRDDILHQLEDNGRIDLSTLAVLIGSDEARVANEVAQMEKEKIICGYSALIDWDKTGIERVTALIEVRVTPQRGEGFDKIAARIYNFPEVESCYLISGGYDLMVILDGRTLKEVSMFVSEKLSSLEAIISTSTHFILKRYKDNGIVMAASKEAERMLVSP
ncbi:MAG: Lrp/AsnC family transcriptional regulator [Lachnospiraceae bacterium]|nr:Lrp/AsnC family transcriptional regulator [Lachnospiraceae bacterium]